MKTKPIPAIIMLVAGVIACAAGIIGRMELLDFTKMLLIVLVVFYIFGCIAKLIIDRNFKEMEEDTTDGESAAEEGEEQPGQEAVPPAQGVAEPAVDALIGVQLPDLQLPPQGDHIAEHQASLWATMRN